PTPFLALAPQTSASTNSAILASEGMFPYLLLLRRRSRLRGRRLRGRRTRNRLRRRSGYRLRRFRRGGLAPRVEDARRRVPAGKISQRQRRDHENDRHSVRNRRGKFPAPLLPKIVELEPPKTAPISAPLPVCKSTTRMRPMLTIIWIMVTAIII